MDKDFFKKAIELIIRIAALGMISYGCYLIFSPFLIPALWGIIIAVGIYPVYKGIKKLVRGNKIIASSIIVALLFAVLALPTFLLTKSFIEGASSFAQHIQDYSLIIPPPGENVKTWPVIGPKLFELWSEFSTNLTKTLTEFGPTLKPVGVWVLTNLTKLGLDILFFIISILVAGVLLVFETQEQDFLHKLATRLSGTNGTGLLQLTGSTIRNVTQGIFGVALIQSALAGIALLIAEVPHAGLWSFLTLVITMIQLPILFILGPIALYLFSYGDTTMAAGILIWGIILSFVDTPLRAIFFGRGSKTPMPIIFFGSIGGMIQAGIIGLFIGAVILTLGYNLFLYWLKEE